MKKIFILPVIAACCMAVTPAYGQLLKFGLKGGVNLTEINWKDFNANKDNTTGFYIGPMAEVTIPIIGLGVDAAVMYSQRGSATLEPQEAGGESLTVKQQGLEVPINLKYTFGLGSTLGVFIAVGPDFFFNFKDNNMEKPANWNIWNLEDKKTQVGLNIGAGVKLFNHLQVGVNYQLPMGDSFTLKKAEETVLSKAKTKTWQVSLAYIF
jgi:opacity protein-like surface antigen